MGVLCSWAEQNKDAILIKIINVDLEKEDHASKI